MINPPPDADAVDDPDIVELASRLFSMARDGATASLQSYLKAGVSANLANQSGDTLTMLAAYHGRAETVRILLEHGADPNRSNDRGQTPLAGAVFKDEADVIKTLMHGGADPEAGHPSAIDTARMFRRPDLMELLVRH